MISRTITRASACAARLGGALLIGVARGWRGLKFNLRVGVVPFLRVCDSLALRRRGYCDHRPGELRGLAPVPTGQSVASERFVGASAHAALRPLWKSRTVVTMLDTQAPARSRLRERLADCRIDARIEGAVRRAAVALIVRDLDRNPEVLFIRRADQEGDPWSGQMAFPGGHLHQGDLSARHAAERETFEEIGLKLSVSGRYLGALEPQRPLTQIAGVSLVVWPYVYELVDPSVQLVLSREVAEVHWALVGPMLRQENVLRVERELGGRRYSLPGFDVNGRIVWGMTFRMLNRLLSLIDADYRPLS